MECPVCKVPLIVVERQGIEVDYCISCRGFWFDSGEIALLAERIGGSFDESFLGSSPAAASEERARRCPRCSRNMEKVAASRTILLDRCPAAEGFWFDARELGALLDEVRTHGVEDDRVFNFLGELFGGPRGSAARRS